MSHWKKYLQPHTVQQALDMLNQASGPAQVIGGGTDLLLDIQQGRHPAMDTLVDVTGIDEMKQIRVDAEYVFIGAGVVHNRIVDDPITQEHAACLTEACGLIGGPQVRNVATLGGNVAHALPAGDGTIGLLALGAEALLADNTGRRWLPLPELFAGPGKPTFDPCKAVLVGFRFRPRQAAEGSAFRRVMRPQGVAIAILNMGIWLRVDAEGVISDARIAMGPAGPKPLQAKAAAQVLCGQGVDDESLEPVYKALLAEASLRTSRHRATAEYRQHLVGVLLRRTVRAAYDRAFSN